MWLSAEGLIVMIDDEFAGVVPSANIAIALP
jgi:hypothetical protein